MKIYFIYVTFGNLKEARKMGGQLVKNKLAACTNIIPTIYSTYVWKNKTMTDKECSMIIKTSESKVKKATSGPNNISAKTETPIKSTPSSINCLK